MGWLEALVLGLVQGFTEFLPISSSAHLRIVPELFNWPDRGSAVTAVLQLGTLVAAFIYFREDVARMLKALWIDCKKFRPGSTPDGSMVWKIAIGTIPVVVLGLTLKKQIENDFRNLYMVACAIIFFSVVLWFAERYSYQKVKKGVSLREERDISFKDAMIIGLFQTLALVPGASRSGVTITGGLCVGLNRSTATRFSFLLSLPAILGAGIYQLYKERHSLFAESDSTITLLFSLIVSGVIGYLSIAFMLNYLRKHTTYLFIIYRLILGVAILILLFQGVLV